MYLNNYKPSGYSPGASTLKQLFWFFLGDFLFRTHLVPIKAFKVFLLRAFGPNWYRSSDQSLVLRLNFPGD